MFGFLYFICLHSHRKKEAQANQTWKNMASTPYFQVILAGPILCRRRRRLHVVPAQLENNRRQDQDRSQPRDRFWPVKNDLCTDDV